ncbi:MAG: FkbM family methyltransferase [Planctomycetes bacterium]|nr:FkbM family methyltransferase [Planctomycetota bacterium]
MNVALVDQRSAWRSLSYFVLRHVLRHEQITARLPGLDLRIRAYTRDLMGRHLYKRGQYEQILSNFVLHELQLADDAVALDLGANLGWYSLLLARRWPQLRIHAFEPEPRNLALLERNVRDNGITNVTVHGAAVAERGGTMEFYPYPEKNMGRHSLVPQPGCTPITVPVTTVDDFLQRAQLDPGAVQFVKLDVEGYELPALQGARSLLAARPRILAEFAPKYLRRAGQDPAALLQFLQDAGFRPFSCTARGVQPLDLTGLADGMRRVDILWQKAGS